MQPIKKYPRTPHIEGSRLQVGDEDLSQISFKEIKNKFIVIEEKVDGANCAISFSEENELLLQSRGHYLTGGYRERHYNLLKQWALTPQDELYNILGNRYIMYGEGLYAKHKIYYDNLPNYFLEFDIFDKQNQVFLDTITRHEMLKNSPVKSVPVLSSGKFNSIKEVTNLLSNSNYISDNHVENLKSTVEKLNLNYEQILRETDSSKLMEGLYIKVEENGIVVDRMKYVRYSFLQHAESIESRWLDKAIIPNKLNKDIKEIL